MRSDRYGINNDALTDSIAGGRPHESHDLTFTCARALTDCKPIAMSFFLVTKNMIYARIGKKRERFTKFKKRG